MSDHDELKAAVERYRKQRKQQGYLHCHRGHVDLLMLADAYLARLAEDEAGEEPVTQEWLRYEFCKCHMASLPYKRYALGVWMKNGVIVSYFPASFKLAPAIGIGESILFENPTRRQLRRLIEALQGEG